MELGIVGGGRAAWAFGNSWKMSGWTLSGFSLRPGSTSIVPAKLDAAILSLAELCAASEIVLVAVRDDSLPEVCGEVARLASAGTMLFHPSGSHTSELFGERELAFSLHPLRALPAPGEQFSLVGTLLVCEGREPAIALASKIARKLGARFEQIPRASKGLYHAAAVFASNYVAAMLQTSSDLMREAGVASPALDAELACLAASAIENWRINEGAARFTGPVARGDAALVEKHLDLLRFRPTIERIYQTVALELSNSLLRSGPDDDRVSKLRQYLSTRSLP